MRRLVVVLAALVVGTAALVTSTARADTGTPVRLVVINSNEKTPSFVGMSLRRAVGFARHHHIRLDVLRVFENKAKGTVTQEPSGLPGPVTLVVSKGPPANLWAVLPGAKGPPVHEECAPGFLVDVDGNGGADTCDGDRVNVATWDYFAPRLPRMYSLGRDATRCQVAAAYLGRRLDLTWDYSIYEMAKAYYGWTFGRNFTDQLVNAGPYNCKTLVKTHHG